VFSSASLVTEFRQRRIASLWRPLAALAIIYVLFAVVTARLPWKLPRLCPFYALTGRDCPLCGLTRGLGLLSSGRVREAFEKHGRSLIAGAIGIGWLAVYSSKSNPEFTTVSKGRSHGS